MLPPKNFSKKPCLIYLHDDGILYTELLRKVGIEAVLNETKGMMHRFDIATKAPTTLAAMEQRIAFMKRMI